MYKHHLQLRKIQTVDSKFDADFNAENFPNKHLVMFIWNNYK